MRAMTIISIGVAAGVGMMLAGCTPGSSPEGTRVEAQVGAANIQATGAGIVSADASTITYTTRCSLCGTAGGAQTVPTPSAGRPYKSSWICPQCNHRHMIMFKVAKP